jgi:hypothetical protein
LPTITTTVALNHATTQTSTSIWRRAVGVAHTRTTSADLRHDGGGIGAPQTSGDLPRRLVVERRRIQIDRKRATLGTHLPAADAGVVERDVHDRPGADEYHQAPTGQHSAVSGFATRQT